MKCVRCSNLSSVRRILLPVIPLVVTAASCGRTGFLPALEVPPGATESHSTFRLPSDVRVTIQSPLPAMLDPAKRTLLILYALPNGNTTEQTAGKRLKEGDDWHFDIQHIAAQTRFLRDAMADANVITVYLEAGGKSWPAWRRSHAGSSREIVAIVESLANRFRALRPEVVLSGHSGGGSFIFGYLNGVTEIPAMIGRIAWLDATYGYEDSLHGNKLVRWLRSGSERALTVFAYNDSIALLNGKPFVSATGGTWYRSRLMQERLAREFPFSYDRRGPTRWNRALGGRVQFLLTENPERTILHTILVERNGFIHALLAGTNEEERGYAYFGERAYSKWIDTEEFPATE